MQNQKLQEEGVKTQSKTKSNLLGDELIFSLTSLEVSLILLLVDAYSPTTINKLRVRIISIVMQFVVGKQRSYIHPETVIEQPSAHFGIYLKQKKLFPEKWPTLSETKRATIAEKFLKEYGHKIESMKKLQSHLDTLENEGFVEKRIVAKRNAKNLYYLAPIFLNWYLKRKREIADDLHKKQTEAKDAEVAFTSTDHYPEKVLSFFNIKNYELR